MPDLSINYAHAWDSMYKGIDDRGPYYRVSYYFTNWADSDNVANQLRGYTARIGGTTIRQTPHQHPLSPNLICMDCAIEGCGAPVLNSSGTPFYSSGFFAHCEYRAGTWGPIAVNDPENVNQIDPTAPILWCSQEIDFDDEVYVHETNKYVWKEVDLGDIADGTATKIPIKVTIGVTTLNLTFPQLPYLPMTAIRGLRNCVNTVAVLGVGVGKLWFKGARTQREMNTDGTITNKLQLVFKERDIEWNKYLRDDKLAWQYIKDTDGTLILPQADLTPLLSI